MENNRKRDGFLYTDVAEEHFSGKRLKSPAKFEEVEEENDDDMLAWLSMDDETVRELSNLLETEIIPSPPFKVKFSGDPFFSSILFRSSSYITINGDNDESCGSSFSESESSVMASVDLGGWRLVSSRDMAACNDEVKDFPAGDGGAWDYAAEEVEARGLVDENGVDLLVNESINGCDRWDDVMMAKFLGEDLSRIDSVGVVKH